MSAERDCRFRSFLFLIGAAVVALCSLLGALGPAHTSSQEYSMSMCLGRGMVEQSKGQLVDHTSCLKYGRVDGEYGIQNNYEFGVKDMVMMVEMPYKHTNFVFTRWFQYMLVDLEMSFKTNEFVDAMHDANIAVFAFDVAIGYRNSLKGPWTMMVNGTIVRHLKCSREQESFYSCDLIPLFELGSVHHLRYLINLRLRFIPLADHVHKFRGLSQLGDMSVMEIHQTIGFTQLWLMMKCILFIITFISLLVFFKKTRQKSRSLTESTLIGLGCAVTWLDFPLEFLSLYVDCPWMIVYNDMRTGIVILAMAVYWIVFIGEHTEVSPTGRTISRYWKQITSITLSCVALFVYEFCERGVQVLYPFFSMWESPKTVMIANVFLWVSVGFAVLYALMLVFALFQVWWSIAKKEKMLENLSESAKISYRNSMPRFKFLLFVLVVTSVLTITTFLPTGLHEYGLESSSTTYSIYSAMLMGSFALWSVYTTITLLVSAQGVQASPMLSSVEEKFGGILALLRHHTGQVEIGWAHTTQHMIVGYYDGLHDKPIVHHSDMNLEEMEGKDVHFGTFFQNL